jgi:hypothetical protein
MAKYRATVSSYGFRGRYWCKGEIVDISDNELNCSAIKHFRKIDKNNREVAVDPITIPPKDIGQIEREMIDAKVKFLLKFKREVPINKKNDINWIKQKLEEVSQ